METQALAIALSEHIVPDLFPESAADSIIHTPGETFNTLVAKSSASSASFTVPSISGLYRPLIPVGQPCITDTDSHSQTSSVASASWSNNTAESKSNRFCSPRVHFCKMMVVYPSHLSSAAVLPPSSSEGLSFASSFSKTFFKIELTCSG